MTIRHPWASRPWVPLAALAAALTLLLAAEWSLPGTAAPHLRQPPVIPEAGRDAAADAAIGQRAQTILARPIFSQDRRPPAVADSNAVQPLPRLTAIVIAAGNRRAIFSEPGEKPLLAGPGGEVGAYRLQAITAGSVALLRPDGGVTMLRPQFLNAPTDNVANNSPGP